MARLLDGGMKVLAQRGYQAARVDDIVRAARTSHGTFYLYFTNKEDLVRALAVECADEMAALAEALPTIGPDQDGRAELRDWLGRYLVTYRRYGAVIRAWSEQQITDRQMGRLGVKAFGRVSGALVHRIREADPSSPTDADFRAAALLAMVERTTFFVSARGSRVNDDALLDTLATLTHRAFFRGT